MNYTGYGGEEYSDKEAASHRKSLGLPDPKPRLEDRTTFVEGKIFPRAPRWFSWLMKIFD